MNKHDLDKDIRKLEKKYRLALTAQWILCAFLAAWLFFLI